MTLTLSDEGVREDLKEAEKTWTDLQIYAPYCRR